MAFWDKILQRRKERFAPDVARARQRDASGTGSASAMRSTGGSAGSETEKPPPPIHPADAFFTPILTEKASGLNAKGAYVFRVHRGVTKPAFARAVSRRYGVAVDAVRMLVMPGKTRRRGRITGWKPGFKKAIVMLKKGEKIEIQ